VGRSRAASMAARERLPGHRGRSSATHPFNPSLEREGKMTILELAALPSP
jgi:hypothetical protein